MKRRRLLRSKLGGFKFHWPNFCITKRLDRSCIILKGLQFPLRTSEFWDQVFFLGVRVWFDLHLLLFIEIRSSWLYKDPLSNRKNIVDSLIHVQSFGALFWNSPWIFTFLKRYLCSTLILWVCYFIHLVLVVYRVYFCIVLQKLLWGSIR